MRTEYALLCLAMASLLISGCADMNADPLTSLEHISVLGEPRPVAAFELSDQHGQAFTQEQLRGRWSILFAGFTHCPDICPGTLALLTDVQQRAGISPEQLRTVFISVDPDRDTPANLAEYLAFFNPEWTALTGPKSELDSLMASLELAYVRVPTGGGDYTVDHSTALVLIDPEGRMRGYFAAPLDDEELVDDLGRIAQVRP